MFMSFMQLIMFASQVALLFKRATTEPADRVIRRSLNHIEHIAACLLAMAPCLVASVSELLCPF